MEFMLHAKAGKKIEAIRALRSYLTLNPDSSYISLKKSKDVIETIMDSLPSQPAHSNFRIEEYVNTTSSWRVVVSYQPNYMDALTRISSLQASNPYKEYRIVTVLAKSVEPPKNGYVIKEYI